MNRPVASPWFVQSAGRVWGPYPEQRIATFVEEGRVAADTLVGQSEAGPFAPAGHQARLAGLFGLSGQPVPEAEPVRPREPTAWRSAERQAAASDPAHAQPRLAAAPLAPARPLLVWASLRTVRPERLEELIGAHGPFVRIQNGLWLVRARMGPPALRNVLTRRLAPEDQLMVLAAPLDAVAWFNLEGDTDRTLRQLWAPED